MKDGSRGSSWRVPVGESHAEIRDKGSRFLCRLVAVEDVAEARRHIDALAREHHDASHVCWAWRLGMPPEERSFDAGEPAGTAGRPMLQVLDGASLTNVLAVGVRWFGGTKLGKGGLARAYGGSVAAALTHLTTEVRVPSVCLELELRYPTLGAVQHLVQPPSVTLIGADYGDSIHLRLDVHEDHLARIEERLRELGVRFRATPPTPARS